MKNVQLIACRFEQLNDNDEDKLICISTNDITPEGVGIKYVVSRQRNRKSWQFAGCIYDLSRKTFFEIV